VGADYLGEAGRWPRIGNGSGLLDRTDFPHPVGLERESWWSTQPNVHMVRRVAPSEQAATDPGYEAVPPRFRQVLFRDWSPRNKEAHTEQVEVYTNAQQVELTLNGKSLGVERLHPDASPLTWEVPFISGVLKATAMSKGKVVAVDELRTAGTPARLELSSENGGLLSPDWNEVRQIAVNLVDANGTVIPDSSTVIHFSVAGPGEIVGVDNGSNTDHDSFQASERKLFEGRAIAIIRTKASSGDIAVTAAAEGVPSATIHLKAVGGPRAETFRSF
jgi:beta-galactosidase